MLEVMPQHVTDILYAENCKTLPATRNCKYSNVSVQNLLASYVSIECSLKETSVSDNFKKSYT